MNSVFREEKKFLIDLPIFISKSHQLSQVLMEDPNNVVNGYKVRSLYFNTPFDVDYFEKQAGIETRRKIRLRVYDPRADFAFIEMKQKQGAQQLKRSLKITREDAQMLIHLDYTPLLRYSETFAAEMYAMMQTRGDRPWTIVEYARKAFVGKENKIRITFDHNIVATESSMELFDEHLAMNSVLDPADIVLEVKFNGFLLSYMKGMLDDIDKSELSVSKYVLARQQSYLTHI